MRFIVNGRGFDANGRPLAAPASAPAPLPDGFPAAALLTEHGFGTLDAVRGASDAQLIDIDGIGPAKLAQIRKAQG